LASHYDYSYGSGWVEYQYNAGPFNSYLAYATQILQLLPRSDVRTMYVFLPPGNYTVNRYYVVDSIQVNTYVPSPPRDICNVVRASGSSSAQTIAGVQKPC
jgi:hypothetical protein